MEIDELQDDGVLSEAMSTMKLTPIESGNKIAIPADWLAELHFAEVAALERTAAGVLVRPCPATASSTWDDIFAKKLPIGQPFTAVDLTELSGDDFLL